MTMIFKVIIALLVLGVGGIVILRLNSWGTKPRPTFDPATGRFAPCPDSPNCVSTQASASDQEHYSAPLPFSGSAEQAKGQLLATLQTLPRLQVITEAGNYLHGEARTPLMGYVDDVEFYIDSASQTIQFRSASRIGRGDLGANRRRMEEIRARFTQP